MKRITREQAFTHGGAVITEAEQEEGLFPLMVEGNALDPNIRAGDVCLFDPNAQVEPGDMVALNPTPDTWAIRPAEEVEAGSRKGVLIRSTRRFKAPKR